MHSLDKLLVRVLPARTEMADKHVFVESKDFASAFLNPSKNSRGYDGELLKLDRNMVKSLFCPPFPFVPSGFRQGLGSRMCRFVEGQLGLSHTYFEHEGQELKAEHEGKMRKDYQGRSQALDEPNDTINIISKCPKVEDFGSRLGGDITTLSFSHDDWRTRTAELMIATDQTPSGEKVDLDSQSFAPAIPSSPLAPAVELENKSIAKISDRQDKVKAQRNTRPKQTLPLTLFKNLATKQDPPMDLSDLTVKIKLQAIASVLENKYKPNSNELNVSGIVAMLYGCYTGDSTVSVHNSDVRGVYNYIDGTVKMNSENEGSNVVDLTLFLSLEMCKAHYIFGCETNDKDNAVAWCISSPGFGVDLDWQVQEKLTKLSTHYCDDKPENFVLDPASAWCTLLVVVDEYRCAEQDLPLIEVYQLKSDAAVKAVNFDFE